MPKPEPPTGNEIKEARGLLSQSDFARRVLTDTSTLRRWESFGDRQAHMSNRMLDRLLAAFPKLRKEAPDVHAPPAPHDPSRAAE